MFHVKHLKGGLKMDWSAITQAVTTIGFPIVMCGAMAWYVKYITDKHREEVTKLNEQHQQEMEKVTTAINNNTLALTKLCERMEKEG
jgi:cellobiose-specific phosphotransferase system component IIC